MTTIASYNVNGVRAAIGKGLLDWIQAGNFDIICLQEIKALASDVPVLEIEALGYQHFWYSAQKKGYSGTAIFTKRTPDKVVAGCGIADYDSEGRILRADFGDWTLLNCYFPSGTSGDERQDFKMQFLTDFEQWVAELRQERPKLIVVGDYNIAHSEIDIHDPKGNKKSSGFLPEERDWVTRWLDSGFTDAFRYKNPEVVSYSWWTFRAGAREKNKGWRIDYQCVTDNVRDHIIGAVQDNDAVHSDHCPVIVQFDF
jgi:exodeoxyribonuclease III